MTIKYKKLVSLNPDEYTEITSFAALKSYIKYLVNVHRHGDLVKAKSFTEWLETEI